MARGNINDFLAFIAVANERSFTKAAAKVGVSQSALSHTIRQLEARLGVRLLARTTRSVSPTEAGEHLLRTIGPRLEEIEAEIEALNALREKPTGTIRITATDYAIRSAIWPRLKGFLAAYPEIQVELLIDYGLTDIVTERFDAGVRLGETVDKDMISVRIGPDVRFATVASASYFATCSQPQHPQELLQHSCINIRLPTKGGLYSWAYEKDGRRLNARVNGQLIFNSTFQVLEGAVAGLGIGHVPEEIAAPFIAKRQLIRVLEDWCPYWDGFHLYYPSRRQSSPAFALLVDALRYRT